MDTPEELAYARLKIAQCASQERKLREALVVTHTEAKRSKQAIQDAQVLLAPLRRLLVTMEADPVVEDFVEARRLVAAASKILEDALDALL